MTRIIRFKICLINCVIVSVGERGGGGFFPKALQGDCLKLYANPFPYLFGNTMPLLMANTHVHTLLVEELALLWDQKNIAHKFPHCKNQTQTQTELSSFCTNYKHTSGGGGGRGEGMDGLME